MEHPTKATSQALPTSDSELVEIIFRDRMKYLSLLSSAIVHELHTPMVIIRGLAESLLRNSNQNPHANIREISKESEHLIKILEAMAFVSTSVEKVKMQNLSLKNILDQVVVFFEQTCLEKKISLRIEVEDLLRVESEPNRLKSILITLISNAVESFDNMTTNKIKSITIHAKKEKKNLHLIISDTGIGMCPLIQERILKGLFFNTKDRQQKSGLGLALAQKMAMDLNIDLGFVSEELRGTSFTLSFPQNVHSIG